MLTPEEAFYKAKKSGRTLYSNKGVAERVSKFVTYEKNIKALMDSKYNPKLLEAILDSKS